MPPKRKQPPRKKKPIQEQDDDVPEEADNLRPERANDAKVSVSAAKATRITREKNVRWARPRMRHWTALKKFAPVLFRRSWNQLQKAGIDSFDGPQLPSPLYEKKEGDAFSKDKDGLFDSHGISQVLGDFYDSLWKAEGNYLEDVANEDAGLLGFQGRGPILLEGENLDGEIRATLKQPEEEEQTASLHIIRRTAPEDTSAEHFLVIPPATTVIVNGTAYQNNVEPTGGDEDNIHVGPLDDFAIIELLQTPIFLWKNAKSVRSEATGKVPKTSKNREINTEGATTTVIFVPSEADESTHPSNDGGAVNGHQSRDPPNTNVGPNNGLADSANGQQATGSNTRASLEDIINPVLLAISKLQQDKSTGFCMELDNILLRPGQPWVLPIRLFEATVLIVLQCAKVGEGLKISIDVLDPLEWNSDRDSREDVWNAASGGDILQRWMAGIGLDPQEIRHALPDSAQWVDSPVALNENEASAITILNAWALAMGFKLNPGWTPPISRARFFREAERLFELARAGRGFSWEIVFQFFTEHRFVINTHPPKLDRRFDLNTFSIKHLKKTQINTQQENDKRIRSLRTVENWGTLYQDERTKSKQRSRLSPIELSGSRRHHYAEFPSDTQSKDFKDGIVRDLIERGLWRRHLNDEELEWIHSSTPKLPYLKRRSFDTPNDPHSNPEPKRRRTLPSYLRHEVARDTSDFSEKHNPCGYLAERLKHFSRFPWLETVRRPKDIDRHRVFNSVAAVVQAVGHAEGAYRSLECIDNSVLSKFFDDEASGELDFGNTMRYNGGHVLLLPWESRTRAIATPGNNALRSVLVVVQPPRLTESRASRRSSRLQQFSIQVIDHAPWLSDRDERDLSYHHLLSFLQFNRADIEGDRLTWITGPPPPNDDVWYLNYYTILNAWAIALDLELDPAFRPRDDFFIQAEQLVTIVLKGLADWKLIWSFLRCHKFVQGNLISSERRLNRTVAESLLDRSRVSFRAEDRDSWTELEDFSVRMPKLLFRGIPISELDQKELGNRMDELEENELEENDGEDKRSEDPCSAFRQKFKTVVKGNEAKINELRRSLSSKEDKRKHDEKLMLHAKYASHGVDAVTLAITKNQNITEGFGYVPAVIMEAIRQRVSPGSAEEELPIADVSAMDEDAVKQVIRFSRPMIVVVNLAYHTMLVVVQYDEKQELEITALDSRPWTLNKKGRNDVHRTALELLQLNWKDEEYDQLLKKRKANSKDTIPTHTTWIPCANQTTDLTCGYHTVFNGWAVALGLELNPRFLREWDKVFTTQAQNILCVAILGKASSELIHSFLECIGFVMPKQTIDEHKKFQHTTRTDDENQLNESLKELSALETAHWSQFASAARANELRKISQLNRVRFPNGRARRHDATWSSDAWETMYKPFIKDVADACQATMDLMILDNNRLTYALRMYSKGFAESAANSLKTLEMVCNGFWKSETKAQSDGTASMIRRFHDYIQLDTLEPSFIQARPDMVRNEHSEYLSKLLNRKEPHKVADDELVVLGIAAVVQAIDKQQADQQVDQSRQSFSGGFALTSVDIQLVRAGLPGNVARPRRCWLLPYLFASGKRAHDFLAVLQEEQSDSSNTRQFCVYFLDSHPQLWDRVQESRLDIFKQVKAVAHSLNWTSQRNSDNRIKFRSKPRYVRVAQQKGGKACPYHTIMNAWILALGLTPNVKPRFDFAENGVLISELRQMVRFALAGLLDWKTLVAWMFARDLTVEKEIDKVSLDRRFDATIEQTNTERLKDNLEAIIDVDDVPLEFATEEQIPYIHSNNVDFTRPSWQIEEPA
ncbi:hypothetical protein SLS60_010880 [Paraconiothyrium brasiliense]|uniref:Ubiquitinyl hydrolase 1 n=1 Tax=Paraconiothyrium brasiliense TaxID=300254 RepID=A0ABR3QM96_9PLEO